jgi:imidazolonepropionase
MADWVALELLPKIWKRRLTRFADVALDGGPEAPARIERILQSARKLGFSCRLHADEENPTAAIRLAVRQQALSVDHLEHAVAHDASLFSGSSTMVTLLPSAGFLTGGGNPPVRPLVDAGVPVALGTNYHSHFNGTLSMQSAIAMACLRMGLTVAEAISAATINAAYSLGISERVGSIEAGKQADLLVLNTRDYRDLANNLGTNLVHATIKGGVTIYREGEVASPLGEREIPAARGSGAGRPGAGPFGSAADAARLHGGPGRDTVRPAGVRPRAAMIH